MFQQNMVNQAVDFGRLLFLYPKIKKGVDAIAEMLVRHASDDKLYLYDMVNTKKEKETNTPSQQ